MDKGLATFLSICAMLIGAEFGYFYGHSTGEDAADERYKASTRVECEQLPGQAEECTKHREYCEGVKP